MCKIADKSGPEYGDNYCRPLSLARHNARWLQNSIFIATVNKGEIQLLVGEVWGVIPQTYSIN